MKNPLIYFVNKTNRFLSWRILVWWTVLILFAEFCIQRLLSWLVAYHDPEILPPAAVPYEPELSNVLNLFLIKLVLVFFAAALYGAYRARYFQSFADPYRSWLIQSPWTADKKLPLGPMHITAPDLVIVVLLAIPIWTNWLAVMGAIVFFLVGYIVNHIPTFYHANQLKWLWISLAFLATMLLFPNHLVLGAIAAGVIVIVGILSYVQQIGLRDLRKYDLLSSTTQQQNLGNSSAPFGFPIGPNQCQPWEPDIAFNIGAICLVWSMFCIGQFLSRFDELDLFLAFGSMAVAVVLAMLRLQVVSGHEAPLNRFSTGRIIIPGYDVVYVAPLSIVGVALIALPFAAVSSELFHFPVEIVCPLATACMFLIYKYMPPNPERWRTTGYHRIVMISDPSKSEKLKINKLLKTHD